MFELLFRLIFTVVGSIVNAIISPFVSIITGMFPDVATYYNIIITFFASAGTYLWTILHWFLFDINMLQSLFVYLGIKFSIWVVSSSVRAGLKLYNMLKP